MRGWMVTVGQYRKLEEALRERDVSVMTQPEQYERCHHLPASYPVIEGKTPESAWTTRGTVLTDDDIVRCAAELGSGPAMVKDYVKSQKHAWEDACFIPELSDTDGLLRVVRRFIELQGDSLAGGVVLRRYVPLRISAKHPDSGMPLAAEFRIFWANHKPILDHKYWADLVPIDTKAPTDRFANLGKRIDSPFFTMDVAELEDGSWTVIELGDGQVAGLPDRALAGEFYSALAKTLGSQ